MEQLNNLDVVFLIITGISALVGIARGMTKEFLSLAGWVLAAAAVFYLVPLVDPITQKYIASKVLASVVSGMIILILFCVVWILTVDKIASVIRSSKLSALDRVLGFVFGTARGIVIVILIALMITTLIPEESKKGVFAESRYFKEASECAEPLMAMVPQSLIDKFKEKSESLGFASADDDKDKAKAENEDGKSETEADAKKAKKSKEKKAKNGKDGSAEKEKTTDENSETILVNPFDLMDSNLEMLQKSGEELFNQLAQPKTTADDGEENNAGTVSSDLDKLLDALEDKVTTTDENTPEMKSDTQKIEEKLKEKLEGKE